MGLHGNLALHAQLTYKQNEKQYYKHTLCGCCIAGQKSSLNLIIDNRQRVRSTIFLVCFFAFLFVFFFSHKVKPNNKSVTLRLAALRPLQSLWTDCSTFHSRGILTEFSHEQGSGWVYDRKTSSSRLSDSGEEAKVKGTRKVGGMGKREKEAPALPSFLPFYFRVRAFSIQRPRLSKSLEQAKLFADVISKAAHFRQLFKDPDDGMMLTKYCCYSGPE